MLVPAVLKHRPADFLVRENLVVALTGRAGATHHYLLLRKSGYTTMEAVRLLTEWLGLATGEVTYGGLKDEDGITEQLVAVPAATFAGRSGADFELPAGDDGNGRWLRLDHYGYGTEPLRIGRLEGNGFRIVVRNLDEARAMELAGRRKDNLFFLNYYDTQRFGVPGGPKRTHLVGAAMLAGDWDRALAELIGLRAPESTLAAAWTGPAEKFFHELDPRVASFYLAAHASSDWNAELAAAVAAHCPDSWFTAELEGLRYRYLRSTGPAVRLLAEVSELPYPRYTFEDGEPRATLSRRATVVQAAVSIGPAEPDELIGGTFRLGLNFFLPSGCYATAAVRQLLADTGGQDR